MLIQFVENVMSPDSRGPRSRERGPHLSTAYFSSLKRFARSFWLFRPILGNILRSTGRCGAQRVQCVCFDILIGSEPLDGLTANYTEQGEDQTMGEKLTNTGKILVYQSEKDDAKTNVYFENNTVDDPAFCGGALSSQCAHNN